MEHRAGKRPCAEFPNDNPGLHDGAIWWCADPCGPAVCEVPQPSSGVTGAIVAVGAADTGAIDSAQTDPVPPVIEADDPSDDLDVDEAVDTMASDAAVDAFEEGDGGDDIEIVDELSELPPGVAELPMTVSHEPALPTSVSELPPGSNDALPPDSTVSGIDELACELPLDVADLPPMEHSMAESFQVLVRVIEEVAKAAGASEDNVKRLHALLGRSRLDASASEEDRSVRAQALAWQTLLNGEGDDFDACGGAMLDDWSSALIARVLDQPGRTDGLKRELRRKGVAAFGIVEEAA